MAGVRIKWVETLSAVVEYILVFPAASRPSIRILISRLPNNLACG
jgi:hypothetical protein